jgi:predicted DNA-binding ribbon-helix-helix protein
MTSSPTGHTIDRPIKRSFRIAGHATSISLEPAFWSALKEAAAARQMPLAQLVAEIDSARGKTNLSSAVRVWLLHDARRQPSAVT